MSVQQRLVGFSITGEIWHGSYSTEAAPRTRDVRAALIAVLCLPLELLAIAIAFLGESASDEIYRVLTTRVGAGSIMHRTHDC